nr:MAG: hypothetical protein [Hemigrapsus takanoi nimavirus]
MVLIAQEMLSANTKQEGNQPQHQYFIGKIDNDCNTLVILCNKDHISKRKSSPKYNYLVGLLTEVLGARSVALSAMAALEMATASVGSNHTDTQRILFSPMNPINDSPSAREVCIVSKETLRVYDLDAPLQGSEEAMEWKEEEKDTLASTISEDQPTAIVDRVLRAASKTIKIQTGGLNRFNFFMIVDNCCMDTLKEAMLEMSGQQQEDITMRILSTPVGSMTYIRNMILCNSLNVTFRGRIKNIIFC